MMRATAEDADAAELVGINSRAVYARATALAVAIATLGGLFLAIRSVFDPVSGPTQLIFAFEAVVIGGMGSLWGTLLGGLALGVAQTVGAQINPEYRSPGRTSAVPGGAGRSVQRRPLEPEADAMKVQRWTRTSKLFTGGTVVLAALLATVPLLFDPDVVQKLTNLLILVLLAAMWNALAGYGGLLSVGQQAFIGIGAYGTVFFAGLGISPYPAMLLATLLAGAISVPISFFALRLRAAQFAIGMWVTAEVISIFVRLDQNLGAGTGISLIQMNQYEPNFRQAYTFWLALAFTVIFLAAVFFLLRSPLGASLQAIRDDEDAARSLGVRVASRKRLLFVLAGFGCGAAGVLVVANTLFIEPGSIFSVQWSAYMIFMVLVGGLGTFEGPILGAILLFAIQTTFTQGGPWYLVGLGATAALFALALPRGLWGTIEERLGLAPVACRLSRGRDQG